MSWYKHTCGGHAGSTPGKQQRPAHPACRWPPSPRAATSPLTTIFPLSGSSGGRCAAGVAKAGLIASCKGTCRCLCARPTCLLLGFWSFSRLPGVGLPPSVYPMCPTNKAVPSRLTRLSAFLCSAAPCSQPVLPLFINSMLCQPEKAHGHRAS